MSQPFSAIAALQQVHTLLVDPHPANMRLAEQKLSDVVEEVQRSGLLRRDWPLFQRYAANCSVLLQQARRFWNMRQASSAPVLQYAAGGQLLSGTASSTFAVEL